MLMFSMNSYFICYQLFSLLGNSPQVQDACVNKRKLLANVIDYRNVVYICNEHELK